MIRPREQFDVEDFFSSGGVLSRMRDDFECRTEQAAMAVAVQRSLANDEKLAVEAGTGVGKSFAYMIPVIEAVCRNKCKALISTFTITLQEQLINKDIPFLAECFKSGFTAVLAKGRSNYLCRRRMEFAIRRQQGLFDDLSSGLAAIKAWSEATTDGSLSDIDFVPKAKVWDKVNSEHGNCRGRRCKYFSDCFYWRARRRLETADIIVANHALMFSDLVIKSQGASLLPEYRYVVIDEAHNIESVAEEHFGIDITDRRVKYVLDGLFNTRSKKGVLAYLKADKAIDIVAQLGADSRKFFKKVSQWYEANERTNRGRCYKNFVDDTITETIRRLRIELSKLSRTLEDEDDKFEIGRYIDRCCSLEMDIDAFLKQERDGYVYWVEPAASVRGATRLKSAAINVGEDVKRCLFDEYGGVILTSATLSCGGDEDKKGFEFLAGRIGLEKFRSLRLGSPFDYEKQVTIYIEKDLPSPNHPEFVDAAIEAIKKYVLRTSGRAFVLFTSYRMLDEAAEKLSGWFEENDIELLQQGSGIDRGSLLRHFRGGSRCVLFGTDSFWQGVDVPGEALSNVIIVRLPFWVPDRPLLAGRIEQIRENGENPFFSYQLPGAIIKFKQGFGRLIRTKKDTGIVVVLDSRIVSKNYGRRFLEAIPKCRVELVSNS